MRREVIVTVTTTEGEVLDHVTMGWDNDITERMGVNSGPITRLLIRPLCPSVEVIPTHPSECELVIGI
jgi:hypothetical protein